MILSSLKLILGTAATVVLLSGLAGCSGSDDDAAATPTPSVPAVADCSANLAAAAPADGLTWGPILPAGDLPAPDGWSVQKDQGDAPFLAVFHGEQWVGGVEILQFPLDGFDPQDGVDGMKRWALEFYDSIAEDRATEYGEAYEFSGDDPVAVSIGELCGIRMSFTGSVDGEVTDRYVWYVTFDQENRYLFIVAHDVAYGGEFGWESVEDVRTYEPALADLMSELRLPVF